MLPSMPPALTKHRRLRQVAWRVTALPINTERPPASIFKETR